MEWIYKLWYTRQASLLHGHLIFTGCERVFLKIYNNYNIRSKCNDLYIPFFYTRSDHYIIIILQIKQFNFIYMFFM